jgi:hypothetical protein
MPITVTLPPSPPFQHHEFGWFGPNDEAENEQSLMEGMLDPTDVGNTNMDLRYVEWKISRGILSLLVNIKSSVYRPNTFGPAILSK